MGSPATERGRKSDETQHTASLTSEFQSSATEVTQAEWRAVMGEYFSSLDVCDACPVERVQGYETVDFCNSLSVRKGSETVDAFGGRV